MTEKAKSKRGRKVDLMNIRAVRTADFSASALVEHTWYCSHPVEWENVVTLAHALDFHIRLTLESVHICSTNESLNNH